MRNGFPASSGQSSTLLAKSHATVRSASVKLKKKFQAASQISYSDLVPSADCFYANSGFVRGGDCRQPTPCNTTERKTKPRWRVLKVWKDVKMFESRDIRDKTSALSNCWYIGLLHQSLFFSFKLKRLPPSLTRGKSQSPSTITLLPDCLISVSRCQAWEEAICVGVGVTPTDDSPLVQPTWPNVAGIQSRGGQTPSIAPIFETPSSFIYSFLLPFPSWIHEEYDCSSNESQNKSSSAMQSPDQGCFACHFNDVILMSNFLHVHFLSLLPQIKASPVRQLQEAS